MEAALQDRRRRSPARSRLKQGHDGLLRTAFDAAGHVVMHLSLRRGAGRLHRHKARDHRPIILADLGRGMLVQAGKFEMHVRVVANIAEGPVKLEVSMRRALP